MKAMTKLYKFNFDVLSHLLHFTYLALNNPQEATIAKTEAYLRGEGKKSKSGMEMLGRR